MRIPLQSPPLRGDHTTLEPLSIADVPGLQAAVSDGRLWECWYTNVPRPEGMLGYVEAALQAQAAGQCLAYVVRDRAGAIVGCTRYYAIDRATPRLEVGYTWYAERVQRSAVNSEAKLLLLGHAFETFECVAVGFATSWFNERSRTAIARLGAKQDGVIRGHLRHADGSIRDSVIFSILASEWPAVKHNLQHRLQQRRSA